MLGCVGFVVAIDRGDRLVSRKGSLVRAACGMPIKFATVARVVSIKESGDYKVIRKRLIFVIYNDRDRVAVPVIDFYKKLILG